MPLVNDKVLDNLDEGSPSLTRCFEGSHVSHSSFPHAELLGTPDNLRDDEGGLCGHWPLHLGGLVRIPSSLSHLRMCWWVFIEMRSWGVRQQSLDLIHIK